MERTTPPGAAPSRRVVRHAAVAVTALLAFPTAASAKTPSAISYLVSGCQVLGSVTPASGDAAISRAFRAASLRFDKAAAKDVAYRPVAAAARSFLRAVARNDDAGATAAAGVVVRTCTSAGGVDLVTLWATTTASAPPPPPPTTKAPAPPPTAAPPTAAPTTAPGPTTTVIPPIAIAPPPNAPGADPRNSAVNQALKDQNSGLPYNFQIPRGFTPNYEFPEFNKAFIQAGREDITALSFYFRDQCLNIGWPVLRVDPPTNIVTSGGSAIVAAQVWCRSVDGGGPGQASPWQLKITIFTIPRGGTILAMDLYK